MKMFELEFTRQRANEERYLSELKDLQMEGKRFNLILDSALSTHVMPVTQKLEEMTREIESLKRPSEEQTQQDRLATLMEENEKTEFAIKTLGEKFDEYKSGKDILINELKEEISLIKAELAKPKPVNIASKMEKGLKGKFK